MKKIRNRGLIPAKVSTIPRQKSQASSQLELYKLVTEQERIQQELQFMEHRIFQLKHRLGVITDQIAKTEETIQELRQADSSSPQVTQEQNNSTKSNQFQTFYLEY